MSLSKSSKRGGHRFEGSPEAGPSKRDPYSSDDDDEPVQRKGASHSSSKVCRQGGNLSKKSPGISKQQQQQQQQLPSGSHGHHNKPAELFRKDLISAMKLADTEILYDDEYFTILDPWRQEWEKGVQVPVNEEEIPPIKIVDVKNREKFKDFKMHLRKYLHEKSDETYQSGLHELTGMQELSEQIVRYDLDDMDVTWLGLVNADREEMGLQVINEWNLERMIEDLENQCYAKTNSVKKTEEGLGIEYDEDIACDVCRQLESEDTNEMVFCDGCDICVHQACYGIQTIPEGSWLCRICALGIKPMCLLCPKRGGAMKSTKSGARWTHVSCALWIPEVSIGCPEKMEPVTKISNIPASRWALVCCLCKERVGACIQCSVKQCKTAFHVTCGFSHNLDMKTILDDTDELDGIHLRAFCPKHTKNRNASDSDSPKKNEEDLEEAEENENDVSEAEMAKQRAEKLKQLEEEFYSLVDEQEIAAKFFIPEEAVNVVTEYWKMKRKVNFNKPLITPKMEEENQMQKQQKDSLSARMKMFVHLRQDLERARNLCYMIGKREKTKKQLFKLQENVFNMQVNVLTDTKLDLSSREAEGIRQFFHFDSIYSSFCHKGSVSKLPRKNLFTLENLKTPKDLDEERNSVFDAVIKKKLSKKMKHSKHSSKHSKHSSGKKEVKKEPATEDNAGNVNSEENSGGDDSKISKFINDTAGDSSDNEVSHYEGPRTDSAQMSHLGKVKGSEEVVMDDDDHREEKPDVVKEELPELEGNSGSSNKRSAGSDLKMKLTSILQSKSLKQKQDKLSQSDHLNSALYVDVENSDNDVFSSESNTDFTSPIQQSRNLFDKFKVKDEWSSSDHPSPDTVPLDKEDGSRHRKGKKKHKKYKQSKLVTSASDESDPKKPSVVETPKEKPGYSSSDTRNIFDIGREKDPVATCRTTTIDCTGVEETHQKDRVRDHSVENPPHKNRVRDHSVEKPSQKDRVRDHSVEKPSQKNRVRDHSVEKPSQKNRVRDHSVEKPSQKNRVRDHSVEKPHQKDRVRDHSVEKPHQKDRMRDHSVEKPHQKDRVRDHSVEKPHQKDRVRDHSVEKPHQKNRVRDHSVEKTYQKNRVRDHSPSKLSFHKKRSSKDWSVTSPVEEKPSPTKKHKKMSPSPRVDPDQMYATIDDDIYIPSGKIQVTERTIVLESPKEERESSKHSNKLRLKKQTNSPVKGVISYEVVKTDIDERGDDISKSAKEKMPAVAKKEESAVITVDDSPSKAKEDLPKSDTPVVDKKTKDGKYGKLLSDSDGNISVEPMKDKEDISVRKDLFGISESKSVRKKVKDKELKRSFRHVERPSELDSSSDENFVPSNNKSTRLSTSNKSHVRPPRECRTNSNSKPVIKPFPNRPDLNALVDPSKLIVKEPLKKRVGDKLSQLVRGRTRWGNRLNPKDGSQQTLDSFVRKSTKLFSPENSDSCPPVRPDLKSPTKSLAGIGLSPRKFLLTNGDVVVQRTPPKNSTTNHNSNRSSEFLDSSDNAGLFADVKRKSEGNVIDDDVFSISSVSSKHSNSEAGDRADTPRRSSRNRGGPDDPQSPQTPSRLRTRDGLIKPSPFKSTS